MVIPLPNLDDRRWTDLVEEGRALVPLYAIEWTDQNYHDPGIMILELLAAIAEMDIYRLNRVPDAYKRKFLALVGIQPKPPVAARTVLRFELAPNTGTMSLPEGTAVVTTDSSGSDVPFRLLSSRTAVSGSLQSVVLVESRTRVDYSQRFAHGESISIFGSCVGTGQQFYLGFTEALPDDAWTSLYFCFGGTRTDAEERTHILDEQGERRTACTPRPNPCSPSAVENPPATPSLPPHQSARLAWEYLDTDGEWVAFAVEDQTRSLTLDGVVRLRSFTGMASGGLEQSDDHLLYVRVTLVGGSYDRAPKASRIILNGAEAEQSVLVEQFQIGTGDGDTEQSIALPNAPVIEDSVELPLWIRCNDFDSSSRADRHFVLDAQAGVIRFGDNEHAMAPAADEPIYGSYRWTLAESGDLPERRVFRWPDTPKKDHKVQKIVNAVPARGGASAESVSEAAERAIEMLLKPERAVTIADYESLALRTPGTLLSRVAVVPNCHPAFDCIRAAGIISIILVPYLPPKAPMPSAGTLSLVAQYLNRRRIIGTWIEVVPPRYLPISVRCAVRGLPGASPAMLAQRVTEALTRFFNPLEGDPTGTAGHSAATFIAPKSCRWPMG